MAADDNRDNVASELLAELLATPTPRSDQRGTISVIIPVYGSPIETLECLRSLFASTNSTDFRVIVVDDASPDALTRDSLDTLAKAKIVSLVRHRVNKGFPGACNSGFTASGTDDVVILNSDVTLNGDWLDRMVAYISADNRIATLTPMTCDDSYTSYPRPFFSSSFERYPLDVIDAVAKESTESAVVTPTGVGYCMYITRESLDQLGGFDEKAFKRGYGEENDFCQKAVAQGYRNLVTPNIFVKHEGGVSFGKSKSARMARAINAVERLHPGYQERIFEFIRHDPLASIRQSLDIGLLNTAYPNGAEVIVTHNLGGGTERAILEHAHVLAGRGICPLVLRTDQRDPSGFRVVLRHALDTVGDNLGDYDLRTDAESLAHILGQFRVRTASVQHLIDFNWFAPDLLLDFFGQQSITYDVVLHDFFLICPRVNMTDGTGRYCGGVEVSTCQSCVITFKSRSGDSPAIIPWHQRARRIITGATAVFAPSLDTVERFNQLDLGARIQYRPHLTREASLGPDGRRSLPLAAGGSTENRVRKVLIIGAISVEKGARLLRDVARLAESNNELLSFHILGYTYADHELALLNNVTIHGAYEEHELQALIHELEPDLVWFPGMWPETFSYTVNSVIESRICPALGFDIGAIGHRIVSEGLGWTVPLQNGLDAEATLRDVKFYSSPIRHRAWVASESRLHDTSNAVSERVGEPFRFSQSLRARHC